MKPPFQNGLQKAQLLPDEDIVDSGCCLFFRRRRHVLPPTVASKQVGSDVPLKETVVVKATEENHTQTDSQVQFPELTTSTAVFSTSLPSNHGAVEGLNGTKDEVIEVAIEVKSRHRQVAEQLLKEAAMKLEKLVPREANDLFQVSLTTQCGETTDVNEITRDIGTAISNYVNRRAGTVARRGAIKSFLETWFSITYPYIRESLRIAKAYPNLFQN
jgi:hypothetical protein